MLSNQRVLFDIDKRKQGAARRGDEAINKAKAEERTTCSIVVDASAGRVHTKQTRQTFLAR
jgi:hypothetical protein